MLVCIAQRNRDILVDQILDSIKALSIG